MQITFLGTSAGIPARSRNVSCVALRLPQRGEVWLFDCGEGTQHQLLKSDIRLSQITRIFITHLHGDHIFGLIGLLATAGMAGHLRGVDLYGPPGLDQYVREVMRLTGTHLPYPVEVHTVQEGEIHEDDLFFVRCLRLKHRVQTFGYCVVEQDQPGHFDVEKAAALGLPAGPLYGRLKRGESIRLPDGRQVDGKDLCGPKQRGRRVAYCTDTIYCRNAVELARDADVLIHEATFALADEELAHRALHSTTLMAAQVALEASVRQLIITHFSPRYARGNPVEFDDLLSEARSLFPQTLMAHDFLTFEVPRRQATA